MIEPLTPIGEPHRAAAPRSNALSTDPSLEAFHLQPEQVSDGRCDVQVVYVAETLSAPNAATGEDQAGVHPRVIRKGPVPVMRLRKASPT